MAATASTARIGARKAIAVSAPEVASSPRERTGSASVAVVALEAARSAARARCTSSATAPPASTVTRVGMSVSNPACPVNSAAPEAGAITVPAAWSAWSSAGTLSPTKSRTSSVPSTTRPVVVESWSNGAPRSTTPRRSSSALANSGSQAFSPAAPANPKEASTLPIAVVRVHWSALTEAQLHDEGGRDRREAEHMVAQDRPARARLCASGGSRRAPSRTAAGTVCAAPARPRTRPGRATPSPPSAARRRARSRPRWPPASPSITAAISRFIGLAAVVTRA